MRCPRILAKVICCGLARVRKMDELAKDRFRRLEQTLRPIGGNRALHAPYLSFAIPVGLGSVAGQPCGRFAQHPVTGLICSLTLGTLLRSRVVLSVSARPDRFRVSSIFRRKVAFWGLAFAIARVR
jgi:hypothetical protein